MAAKKSKIKVESVISKFDAKLTEELGGNPNIQLTSAPKHENAYVWLLMKGDSYLPGIFTSVFSVLRTKPDADLVVMVTDDVSQNTRNTLMKVATHLADIPYLTFETKPLKTQKQQDLYKNWASDSYTKWNMLALPYRKVLFIDGDTIALGNVDHLFGMETPAAPFSSPFMQPLGSIKNYTEGKKDDSGYLLHDEVVSQEVIRKSLTKDGNILTASAVLISPSTKDYQDYIDMVKSMQPFGFSDCHSMVDEQSIAYFYVEKKNLPMRNVHHRYNLIAWKKGFLEAGDIPYILHYFSDQKPWSQRVEAWPDLVTWYKMAHAAIEETRIKPEDIKLLARDTAKASSTTDTFIKTFANVSSSLDLVDILK